MEAQVGTSSCYNIVFMQLMIFPDDRAMGPFNVRDIQKDGIWTPGQFSIDTSNGGGKPCWTYGR
jgi:hypothetical protein